MSHITFYMPNKYRSDLFNKEIDLIKERLIKAVNDAIAAHSIPEGEWLKLTDYLYSGEERYLFTTGFECTEDPRFVYFNITLISDLNIYQLIELLSLIPDLKP